MKRLLLLICIMFLLTGSLFAEEPAPPQGEAEGLALTLKEAVRIALGENLALKRSALDVESARADILVNEGEFDPALSANLLYSYEKRQSVSALVSPEDKELIYDLSLGGKLRTGTEYTLDWTNRRVKTNLVFIEEEFRPYYASELKLNLSHPLLKGRGREVQEALINAAERAAESALLIDRRRAEEIVLDAGSAYWELLYRIVELDVARLSFKFAEAILDETRQKIEVGTLAPVEIYEVEAEVYSRREAIINAEKALKDANDTLKRILNLADWTRDIVPTDEPPPPDAEFHEPALSDVLQKRADYKAALEDIRNREILERFYKNQALPELDLLAGAGLNAARGKWDETYSDLVSTDYYSWEVGLGVTIPINNRTARGTYRKARYETDKAKIAARELEQGILYELREARRAAEASRQSIEASASRRVASQRRFEAERERFRVGLAVLNDVFRLEVDYNQAVSDENRARANYAIALMRLDQVSGRLLESYAGLS